MRQSVFPLLTVKCFFEAFHGIFALNDLCRNVDSMRPENKREFFHKKSQFRRL
jgi:hypothetical protein